MTQRTRPAARSPGRPGAGAGRTGAGAGTSTVTPISAGRYANRGRARRWEGLRPLVTLVVLLVLAGLGGWAVYGSPWLTVRRVEVSGLRELDRQAVLDAARVEPGEPLARLDTGAVRGRLAALPRVRSVRVERGWPHTVRIAVEERQTAAVVAGPGGFRLIDPEGFIFGTAARRPPRVPLITAHPKTGAASLRAAIEVLGALPPGITRRVRSVRAVSPDAIVLGLTGGVTVAWGSAASSDRKAQVLAALMRHPAAGYDVSAPDAPTTRGRPAPAPAAASE